MSNTERELIESIRNSKNPSQALLVAIEVITSYLKQPLSFGEQVLAGPQALA